MAAASIQGNELPSGDGTNLSANPTPGPTCTSALDDAAKLTRFTWDGTYSDSFDDYFVTKIGGSVQTASQFWGVLLNWQFTPVGGCQQKVTQKDEILWAYDAFNKAHFLKLDGPATAKVNVPFQGKYRPPVPLSRLTDGSTKAFVPDASIAGLPASAASAHGLVVSGPADASGHVTVTFKEPGVKKIKASKDDSIRSNTLTVVVLP
ncbi:hypothetical protein FRC09_014006 [Ceratobasidium sp. 395]|nr:hypothetical protein FRC09_014006 [Ceratobasidium sp. 395]